MRLIKLFEFSIIAIIIILTFACGKKSEESSQTDTLVQEANQEFIKLLPDVVAQMTDDEIVAAVIARKQEILAHLKALDPATLRPGFAAQLPVIIQKISDRITQLQTDPAAQAKLVEKIRNHVANTPPGSSTGAPKMTKFTLADFCARLKQMIDANQFPNDTIRDFILKKYATKCVAAPI